MSEERKKFARMEADLENQLAVERNESAKIKARLNDQLVKERRESAEMQANFAGQLDKVRENADNMEEHLKEQLDELRRSHDAQLYEARESLQQLMDLRQEQLGLKELRIHELDQQVQTHTETIQQTRLALNRTANELNDEKRKVRQARDESAIKNQQLEFVQQQCAILEERLSYERDKKLQLPIELEEDLEEVFRSITGGGEVGAQVGGLASKWDEVSKMNTFEEAPEGTEEESGERVQCAQQ
jgi:chromosome segregation ATPase